MIEDKDLEGDLGGNLEGEESSEPEEYEVEMTGPLEYIQAAYFAFSAVEDVDTEILPTEAAKRRIKRIKFKAIRIIDECINDLYSDLFGDEDPE
jgi:hypothetical protein